MKNNIKTIIFSAVYASLMTVLSIYGTFSFHNIKFTLQNIPLYLAAITLGAIPGAMVGFIGMFINQMLTYGFTTTTLFWVLPHTIIGMFVGYLFEKKIIKVESELKFCATIIVAQILLTLLNTVAFFIDSTIYGYYSFVVVFGELIIRIMIGVITGIAFCMILPLLVKLAKKIH